jgi:RNA recognition motif-containing protein
MSDIVLAPAAGLSMSLEDMMAARRAEAKASRPAKPAAKPAKAGPVRAKGEGRAARAAASKPFGNSSASLDSARVYVGNLAWTGVCLADSLAAVYFACTSLRVHQATLWLRARLGPRLQCNACWTQQLCERTQHRGRSANGGAFSLHASATPLPLPSSWRAPTAPARRLRIRAPTVTWSELKDHIKAAGLSVAHVDVPANEQGRSKGFALVEFTNKKDAARAITELTDTELGGRKIFVREDREAAGGSGEGAARPARREEREPRESRAGGGGGGGAKVHVGNLPYDVTWKELKDIFKAVGAVVRAEVPEGADGRSRGWGTVEFASGKDASRAIKEMHQALVNGREITVKRDEH